MSSQKPKHLSALLLIAYLTFLSHAKAVTLTSGQENFVTSSNITEIENGIESSLSGAANNYNTITNNHIITTGDDGAESGAYGITISGNYNQITNSLVGQIITTGSSGRAIDVDNLAIVRNFGEITTLGSSGHGIYTGDNNQIYNSNLITTNESSAVGIYLNGDNNFSENSGAIITNGGGYGVRLQGNNNNFTNQNTITTNSGNTAYGIYISAASASNASSTNFSTVINDGTISANSHGIYNLDNFSTITNNATINSSLSRTGQSGIRSEANNVTINNSGTINSNGNAIYSSGNNVIINNSGTLNGGVRLGNATLNILGGQINGTIDGNDVGIVSIGSATTGNVSYTQTNQFENLAKLIITNNSEFFANNLIEANSIEIAENSNLTIEEGFESSSLIVGATDGVGNLNINTNFSANSIGQNGNSLANVNIGANADFAISNDIYSQNINIFGTLNSSAANNLQINGNIVVNNAGALNIGNNSQIITGDFELKENGILQISLADGNIGNLVINENAIISENAKLQINSAQNSQYIANNTSYNLISANDLSQINQISNSNITIDDTGSNLLGLLEVSTKISDNGLDLNISRISANQLSQNENIKNIYNNLNEISASSDGNLLDFQNYLNSGAVSIANAESVIEQIAPFSLKAILQTSFLNISEMANLTEDRLINYENIAKKHQVFWVKGFGQKTTQDQIKSDVGFSANTKGIIVGSDKEIAEDFILGFALSYLRSNIKSENALQSNEVSSHQAEIYSRKNFDDYFFDNFAGFSLNEFSQKRSIESLGIDATSSYFGQTFLLKSQFGKKINLENNFIFTPKTSLKYVFSNLPSYEEKGAKDLNLSVSKANANFLEGAIGTNIGWKTTLPKIEYNDFKFSHLTALLDISYSHFLIADKPDLKANLQNQSQDFDYKISQIDDSRLDLGFLISLYNEYDAVFNLNLKRSIGQTSKTNFIGIDFVQRF